MMIINQTADIILSGITIIKRSSKRVIVYIGGGIASPNKFEYYDVPKNKCITLRGTKNDHSY